MDYGTKRNILNCFIERNCKVRVFSAKTSYEEVLAWNPDGFFLSNGPGDPASMDYAIDFTKKVLAAKKPIFGICLGHQILSLALDVPTYKMHHGHRGVNHPVINKITGLCEVTSQNHGFGVSPDALAVKNDTIQVTHMNLNDDTVEGIQHRQLPAFSVQYHPESSPGPHDSRYLFDNFIDLINKHK
jgi:carbamoyl-phosphate synthase small subunit